MIKINTKGDRSPGYVGGNYSDNSTTISITNRLTIFDQFRQIFSLIRTPLKYYLDNPIIDFHLLADSYFNNKITVGQQITVKGYLSKYLLTHRSNFHIPYTQKAGETKITPNEIGHGGSVKMEIKSINTQLPIQSFPHIKSNGVNKYIYFLYQPDFESFILEEDSNKKNSQDSKKHECILRIKNKNKPIVIISPFNINQKAENLVKITGILNEFDINLTPIFSSFFSETQAKILENSFRPYNESVQSLCIDLSEKTNSKLGSLNHSLKSVLATIYAETHFENTGLISNYSHYIGDLLPNAYPGLHWSSFNSNNGKIACGLCESNVSIVTRDFSEFAYYIETDLVNKNINKQNIQELKVFIDTFRKNVRRFCKKQASVDIVNVYDFLYDYSRAAFFHPKGIMSSQFSKNIVSENNNLEETQHWLQCK
ncbi:MAG: hypothetical protein VSS75_007240 [Candidatus Parabeggiatoa sp.]|nr:hypothetical protein [Candidatus Parabeggiatoa sp.]